MLETAAQPAKGTVLTAGATFSNTLVDFNASTDSLDLKGFAFDPLAIAYESNGNTLTVMGGTNDAQTETFSLGGGALAYTAKADTAGTGTVITAVCCCSGTLTRTHQLPREPSVRVRALDAQ